MYTSSIRETDKEVAFRSKDVFDFINKPLTNEKLIDLINKI
jgi:FixJ family two-component response regulator